MNGFIDVLVALQWVQNYVRGFHGNPTAVTLWGQSSGSVAVCTLNVSPRAKGLFQNVIMQSGPCTGAMWGVQGAEAGAAVADAMMTHFKVTTIDEVRPVRQSRDPRAPLRRSSPRFHPSSMHCRTTQSIYESVCALFS
jgi:para-nitrobenzyl esterase